MSQSANKLVGTQYLDLTQLRVDVAETNKLLKSIGAGINLNMSDVVEKQVKDMLTRFKTEIQNATSNMSKSGQKMANGLSPAATQIQHLLSTTQKLGKDGSLTETRKGYDALGRSITEVYKNGLLLNKSLTAESALSKDIQYANKLYQEQISHLKNIYRLKTQRLKADDGTPVAGNLDKQIKDTQKQIDVNSRQIALLDKEAVSRSKLAGLAVEEAAVKAKYTAAQTAQQEKLNAAKKAEQDYAASGLPELQRVQQAYKQLTTSYRQYIIAVKNGNEAEKTYWSQSAQQAMKEIQLIEQKLPSLNIEESIRKKILDLINQAKNAEATHTKTLEDMNSGASRLDQTLDRIGSRLIQMAATMLVLRGQTSLWRNATTYAQEYYDKLNEIRIVTGKSQAEVNRLGQSYRTMAKNMKVSSTEIATAAVEFWRQGLDEKEVNHRLTASIQYAKISAMEFDEAAELITAATNTMGVSAQRVVDVFAYLGDASASGPDEIGIAMQKASASAIEFGLSFEWLGAYIATISEKTRQAPEVIGTSLNSIMARLHSIKEKGFNEDDATKINDVAKALSTIDVELIDSQGNWRSMSDIFSDIAEKWDTLDAKTQSYIATTMAGTRQQNYFLALMSDMALGIEGGSRAYELYAGAMNAAGTASQKYAIWQDSVTAAQNRLTAALESFYALLDAEWMKGFYDGMAGLVEIITAGTDALGGWNLMIPVIVAGVIGLISIVVKATTAIKAMQAALAAGSGIATVMSGGAVGAIIAAVAALAAVVTMIAGSASVSKNEPQKTDYSGTITSLTNYRDNIDALVTELEALAAKTELTAEEQARADEIMRILSGTSITMKAALETGSEGFVTLGERAAAARGEVRKTEDAIRSLNAADALQNLRDSDNTYFDAITSAQDNFNSASSYTDYWDVYQDFLEEHPSGTYKQQAPGAMGQIVERDENFYVFAQHNATDPQQFKYSDEDKARIQAECDFWQGIVDEMEAIGIDELSTPDEVANKMLEFNISAGTYANASLQTLDDAWRPVMDDLYVVMTDGTRFDQLPSFMQEAAIQYYDGYTGAIDKQASLAEGDLMAMAADLTGYVDGMVQYMDDNADFAGVVERFDELLAAPVTQETVDELNSLLPIINEYITAYNELNDDPADDIPLIPEFTVDSLQEVQEEATAAGQALASMNTSGIYKDLELARVSANGFMSVLSRIGESEGQFTNLHDAVMDTARGIAEAAGITDGAEIAKIGEYLLEGLYDTYPGIADYVDRSTGMLIDGWEDGIAKATDPWADIFETKRIDDALEKARQDMLSMDDSDLWNELLSPDGKGLYQYAEDWARAMLPEGTEEEILELAGRYVEIFFSMFTDIDTEIMNADGRIADGMEGIVLTMRQAAHDTQTETSKIVSAYRSLHADSLARDEAIGGLRMMSGLIASGDTAGANDIFEAMSDGAISMITSEVPWMIELLHDGTATVGDFDKAIEELLETENRIGADAWKDYFDSTEAGLDRQTVLWGQTMRGIISVVTQADDRQAAFYDELTRLSNEGVDISGMLDQYGYLGVLLLDDTMAADDLYKALNRMETLDLLKGDIEHADALSEAAKIIDPTSGSYDTISALDAYAMLEAEFTELGTLQRGTEEYYRRAKELTDEHTAAVYREAAAYGVVTDIQARSAQYAAEAQRDRRFRNADRNTYAGGVDYLSSSLRQAEAYGDDIGTAWLGALTDLDEMGILSDMIAMFGDISGLAEECGYDVEEIIKRLYEMWGVAQDITLSDMASDLRQEREANLADTNNYQEQVDSLLTAFGDGGVEGVERAMAVWNSFDESMQRSIAETYPSLVIMLDDANTAAGELENGMIDLGGAEGEVSDESRGAEKRIAALGAELENVQQSASSKYFRNTARAIEGMKHGTVSVTEAFEDYNAEAEKAAKANEQYQKASKKMAAGMEVTVDEIDVLAEYLGNIDPAILLANWDQVGPMIANALAEGEAAFDRLNEAAFIVITGTSVADFSALTSGLVSVKNLADDAVQALIATGQWTLETITLPQEGAQWDPLTGTWTRTTISTNQNVLRYTGSNPLRSTSGRTSTGGGGGGSRGGGGGSGSSGKSVSKSIEKLLDKMDEATGTSDHRRKMAQLAQQYHDVRGELQGVILYLEKEKQIVLENTTATEGYIAELEKQIEAKRAMLAKYKESSSKYKQAMADLEALQEQHKKYSEELAQNKIDLEELEQAIQEQHDTIRQMEIDLRDTIHDAIMDREELNRRMLEGRIDLENELIDVLTRRYEKERDELLETAELKREALNEELTMLDEQLEARRKLSEEQDKAQELAEKEAQLARIAADPTRQKEALALRGEIAELREEMAWDLAEDEVDAQKNSIEEQIKSIDDYIEYIENYYEELLSDPRKLIEELQELLTKSDEEIISWLQQNHEDFATATDATRQEMLLNWQEMLDDMYGRTKTYWDEVEAIIAQGDDAIIAFLKENSADYKEAGKLQAEAYVDEWRKQLEELRKALQKVSAETKDYEYTATSSNNSGGNSSGSNRTATNTKVATGKQFEVSGTGYAEVQRATATSVKYDGNTYVKDPKSNYWYKTSDAQRIDGGRTYYWPTGTTKYMKKYAEGGMAYDTGIAWLDGTKTRPERILSPYQTELFEDLLKTLHTIRTFPTPSSVVQPHMLENRQQSMTIENIIVQVQKLESEQDYEEMAERVGEQIMDKVSRGMTVGGIRLG